VTGARRWVSRYDGPEHFYDRATSIAAAPDGRIIVTGQSEGFNVPGSYTTVAYDSDGRVAWVRRYGKTGQATGVTVSPDGSETFVTGYSGVGAAYTTLAYTTSDGAIRWIRRYSGPDDTSDFAAAVSVAADGSQVFVTGQSGRKASTPSGVSSSFATVAYDPAGNQLWVRRYDGPSPGTYGAGAIAMAVSPFGSKVFVTGYSTGLTSDLDYTTVAYDG